MSKRDSTQKKLVQQQNELIEEKEEYKNLFELAPCFITVQDRDFRLIKFNKEFAKKFDPQPGQYCYQAYKGRSEKCEKCPVVKTFEDGKPHFSEEMGVNKNGSETYWLVRVAPIKDEEGNVVAAMEMCLDVTQMKFLEKEVRRSREKYQTIFNTIPNPVFVLDKESLQILDCNNSVVDVYGFNKDKIINRSFLDFMEGTERDRFRSEIETSNILNQVRQIRKDGNTIYVNIRISISEYYEREVLLVTVSDITKRLTVEQQLIQASKMATLGEMATGIAHELNQPLSVIKTASSFLRKKVTRKEEISVEILQTMAEEIYGQVDRASKIINHMREFGHKSDVKKVEVQVNDALEKALEIFTQQLKLREIAVIKELDENLPLVLADLNRLEQVFINLLINARDAIEEKYEGPGFQGFEKKIILKTYSDRENVVVEVQDTGGGIPQVILGKIFEPFFTTKTVGKGTGLGLSISYGILQDYAGTIDVETKEGKGSKFIIRFPVAGKTF